MLRNLEYICNKLIQFQSPIHFSDETLHLFRTTQYFSCLPPHLASNPIQVASLCWTPQLRTKSNITIEIKMYKKSTIKMIYSHSSNQYQWYFNIFVISARFSSSQIEKKCALCVHNGALIESYYFGGREQKKIYISRCVKNILLGSSLILSQR